MMNFLADGWGRRCSLFTVTQIRDIMSLSVPETYSLLLHFLTKRCIYMQT